MENNMIMVKSASDFTLVVNIPDIPLHRTWKKRGAQFPIERKTLIQAYYDPSVEALFKEGMLTTNDVEFLKEVGLIEEDGKKMITTTGIGTSILPIRFNCPPEIVVIEFK